MIVADHPKAILFFSAVICLFPFINRPVFVDDHAHFKEAIERGRRPLDVYSGERAGLGWEKGKTPTEANGPVYFYLMGAFTRLFGTDEWKAHLFVFLITFLGLLAFHDLAQRYTAYPLWSSLIWLTTPHIWLTANSLLLDSFLAPFLLVGLALFIRGWDTNRIFVLISGAIVLSLTVLIKYTGLIGLIAACFWVLFEKREAPNMKWAVFLAPLSIIAAWLLYTHSLYDESHFAAVLKSSLTRPSLFNLYLLCAFLGATAPILILSLVIFTLNRKIGSTKQAVGLGLFLASVAVGALLFITNVAVGVQLGFWAAVGVFWIYSIFAGSKFDARSKFLIAWAAVGFLGLLVAREWICARYLVVISAPIIILNVSLLEKFGGVKVKSLKFQWAMLFVFGLFTFLLGRADLKAAWADKKLADELNRAEFVHHAWYPAATLSGLSFYLDPNKFRPIGPDDTLATGDVVVLPTRTLPQKFYPKILNPQFVGKREFLSSLPFRTLGSHAGFYGSIWGPLPFSISRGPLETFILVTTTEDKS